MSCYAPFYNFPSSRTSSIASRIRSTPSSHGHKPPNSNSLSDGVIGSVVQRAGSVHTRVNNRSASRELNADTHSLLTHSNDADSVKQNTEKYETSSYHSLMTKERNQQINKLLGRKRHQPSSSLTVASAKKTRTDKSFESIEEYDKYGDLIEKLVSQRDLRRERCRTNQARYRKKQQKYLTDLEVKIDHLRHEIQNLEKKRQVISFGIPTKETVWNIAAEYFRLFRHGFIAPVTFTEQSGEGATVHPRRSHVQLEFLQATMSIDVPDGTVRGVYAMLENWRLFSLYHNDLQLQLERLEKGYEGSVSATVKTSITITENTLNNLYPHVLVDEFGDNEWSPLARRLLNQRIEMEGTIRFGWDHSSGRVSSLETKSDMLTPMLGLLGSLEDVARVFDGALITLEGKLVKKLSA